MTHEQEARELLDKYGGKVHQDYGVNYVNHERALMVIKEVLRQRDEATAQRDKAVEALRSLARLEARLKPHHEDDDLFETGIGVWRIRQAAAVVKEIDGK